MTWSEVFPRAALLVFLPLLGAILVIRVRRFERLASLLLLLLVAERAFETSILRTTVEPRDFYPRPKIFDSLPLASLPSRVVGVGTALRPNLSSVWGLEDVRGYNALTLDRYAQVADLWAPQRKRSATPVGELKPLLSLMNVRYALVPSDFRAPKGWKVVSSYGASTVLENEYALPRAFFPRRVAKVTDPDLTIRWLEAAEAADFTELVWLERTASKQKGETLTQDSNGEVTVERWGSDYSLRTSLAEPSWLFVSVAAWPGWQATASGRPLEVAIADHAFIAVRVPAGEQLVELRFSPRLFEIGLWISAATASALLCLFILYTAIGTRRKAAASTPTSTGAPTSPSSPADTPACSP